MLLRDPKNRLWIVVVVLLAVAAVAWYGFECSRAGRLLGGSSRPGFWYGVAGGLICVFEMLLWPRKAYRRWGQTFRLGLTQTWMRAHVWIGLLSLPLLVMHGGVFPWGGTLSTALMALFLIVIASGIWGLAMQQILPQRLLDEVPAETIYSQIDYVSAQMRGEAARLVLATCGVGAEGTSAGRTVEDDLRGGEIHVPGKTKLPSMMVTPELVPGSEPLLDLFQTEVAPFLCPDALYDRFRGAGKNGSKPGTSAPGRLGRSPLGKDKLAAMIFEELKPRLDRRAHPAVDALAEMCDRRRQFQKQARIQAMLHNWLAIHLPLSVALIVLMFVHILVTLKYI